MPCDGYKLVKDIADSDYRVRYVDHDIVHKLEVCRLIDKFSGFVA